MSEIRQIDEFNVSAMSDREIAEETLKSLKTTEKMVKEFIATFANSGGMSQILNVVKMFSR